MFLTSQTENIKTFDQSIVPLLSSKSFYGINKLKVVKEIVKNGKDQQFFSVSSGRVELHSNQIFNMEHICGNVDVVLPKVKKHMEWIVLWYNQDNTIYNVSHDSHSKIKIYGNGSRIMGLDEPMICDMPFMSLRLTYVNDIDGWIVT